MPPKAPKVPGPSEEERSLQREQLAILREQRAEQAALQPFLLARLGFRKGEGGEFVPLTEEERLERLSPSERQLQEVQELQGERLLSALRGELPVDPALEENLQTEEVRLRERLSRRLGPEFEQTTSGIRALSEFQKRAESLRSGARRGEIGVGTGLLLSQLGGLGGIQQQRFGQLGAFGERGAGLFGRFGQAQQPFQQQRGLQFQAAQAGAQQRQGFLGGVGQLAGTLLGGAFLGPAGAALGGGGLSLVGGRPTGFQGPTGPGGGFFSGGF
jgi:hypothetical protein